MTQFVALDSNNRFCHCVGLPDGEDFQGPPAPTPEPSLGFRYVPWQDRKSLAQPTATSICLWGEDGPEWIEMASVEELRASKNAEINACRESANASTFTFRGKAIRCRPLDRSDIDATNGYVALFGDFPEGWAGLWKTDDNSYVVVRTVDDWKAFYKAMVDTGNANFRHAQQLKSQLAAAETPEQIAAIKWETPIV